MKSKQFISYLIIAILSMFTSTLALAQDAAPKVEMATKFYGEGKIYIVIAVLLIIFTGIIVYLFNLDKKISKIEKEVF